MPSFARYIVPTSVTLGLAVLLLAEPVSAQASRLRLLDLEIPILSTGGRSGFVDGLLSVISFVLLLGGLLAFFYILYGGFVYLTSGGDPAKASTGTKMITNAIIGVIIIFVSYSLVAYLTNRLGNIEDTGRINFESGRPQ